MNELPFVTYLFTEFNNHSPLKDTGCIEFPADNEKEVLSTLLVFVGDFYALTTNTCIDLLHIKVTDFTVDIELDKAFYSVDVWTNDGNIKMFEVRDLKIEIDLESETNWFDFLNMVKQLPIYNKYPK